MWTYMKYLLPLWAAFLFQDLYELEEAILVRLRMKSENFYGFIDYQEYSWTPLQQNQYTKIQLSFILANFGAVQS